MLLFELTILAEEVIEAAHEREMGKYSELAAECWEEGWSTSIYPMEVGCRGYLAKEAEKGSVWLWLRRKVGKNNSPIK